MNLQKNELIEGAYIAKYSEDKNFCELERVEASKIELYSTSEIYLPISINDKNLKAFGFNKAGDSMMKKHDEFITIILTPSDQGVEMVINESGCSTYVVPRDFEYIHQLQMFFISYLDCDPTPSLALLASPFIDSKGNLRFIKPKSEPTIYNESKYDLDLQEYLDSFECINCETLGQDGFAYSHTTANCEVWNCKKCNTELTTPIEPNEDNY